MKIQVWYAFSVTLERPGSSLGICGVAHSDSFKLGWVRKGWAYFKSALDELMHLDCGSDLGQYQVTGT